MTEDPVALVMAAFFKAFIEAAEESRQVITVVHMCKDNCPCPMEDH